MTAMQQEEGEEPLLLLLLPADVTRHVLSLLEATDTCALSCSSIQTAQLVQKRRMGVLRARHCSRVHLRKVRSSMQARSAFVEAACSMAPLYTREACQAQILDTLQVREPAVGYGIQVSCHCLSCAPLSVQQVTREDAPQQRC